MPGNKMPVGFCTSHWDRRSELVPAYSNGLCRQCFGPPRHTNQQHNLEVTRSRPAVGRWMPDMKVRKLLQWVFQ
jgi:hypothetical protein